MFSIRMLKEISALSVDGFRNVIRNQKFLLSQHRNDKVHFSVLFANTISIAQGFVEATRSFPIHIVSMHSRPGKLYIKR